MGAHWVHIRFRRLFVLVLWPGLDPRPVRGGRGPVIEAASREPAATTTFEANEWLPTGERVTRAAVTAIMALIALLTFAFSFGNIWALGLSLGVSPWIAPLVGPAADLSVVGLLVAVRYLSLRGVDGRHLRPARFLLAVTGVATLTLNVAWPVAHRAYGRAA